MKASFTIPGRLPSLNEYISACKRAWFVGEGFKKKQVRLISLWIIYWKVPVFTKPVFMHFRWFEKDKRRDGDNIRSGEKFVMDTLRDRLRIKNDTRRWVLDSKHEIFVDKVNPRVEVTIEEQ